MRTMVTQMPSKDPITSIEVHTSTKALLDALKANGQSYEELILEMAEEHFPTLLINRLRRRFSLLRGPTAEEVFRRAVT